MLKHLGEIMNKAPMNITMEVKKVNESGYEEALKGLSLNKKQTKYMYPVAKKLAPMDKGHNKFLESIYVWLEVKAPRYWWQEADTYRLSTKQSESTMHTLIEDLGTKEDLPFTCTKLFEDDSISHVQAEAIYTALNTEGGTKGEILSLIKRKLPEGFLQTRMWCMSYKTLKNIVDQRSSHLLPHWQAFCESVKAQIDHPEFIFN